MVMKALTKKTAVQLTVVLLVGVFFFLIGLHHHEHRGDSDHCPLCVFTYSIIFFSTAGVFYAVCLSSSRPIIIDGGLPYRNFTYSRCAHRRAPPFLS